jgi:GT2 family glycosyltransferase
MIIKHYDVFYSPLMDFIPEENRKVRHTFQPFNAKLLKIFNFVMNPSAAFSKEMFDRVGQFDPTFEISEDYDLYLRMLNSGAKFGCTDKILVNYRRSPASISVNKFPLMHEYVMKCRIKNGIPPFDIEDVKKYASSEIIESVLSKSGRKLWRDDRYNKK